MGTPADDDKHLLDTLTDEERAAMGDTGVSDGQLDTLKRLAAGAGDEEDDDDDSDEVLDADGNPVVTETTVAAAPAAAPAPAAAAPAPAPATAAEAPAAAPAPAPRQAPPAPAYHAELPEDFDTQVAQLKTDRDALASKFKAGEIDVDTYNTEVDKLNEKRDDLSALKTKVEISREMTAQQQKQAWEQAGIRLADRVAKEDGFDYRTDDAKRGKLNIVLKAMASDPDLDTLTPDELLDRAHAVTKATYGWGKPAAAPAAAAPAPAPKPAERKPPIDAVPKTLAAVPGGDGPGDVGGEFAELDALDGEEFEAALARMTPAARQRYQHAK